MTELWRTLVTENATSIEAIKLLRKQVAEQAAKVLALQNRLEDRSERESELAGEYGTADYELYHLRSKLNEWEESLDRMLDEAYDNSHPKAAQQGIARFYQEAGLA